MKNILCIKRTQFDEIMDNKVVRSPKELFKIDYYLYIIDQTITAFQSRFEQFKMYEDIFCFLFCIKKLKSLDADYLKKCYLNLKY